MDTGPEFQTNTDHLQVRATWWGFVLPEERGSEFEDRLRRNSGLLAFSTALAGPGQVFDPIGWHVCSSGSHLKVVCQPSLFKSVELHSRQEVRIDAGNGRRVMAQGGVWEVFLADGIALASFKHFLFAAFTLTVDEPTAECIDPPAEWLAEGMEQGRDWQKAAMDWLKSWLGSYRYDPPRILVGHGGQCSIAIDCIVEEALGQHVCMPAYGPSASPGQVDGGIWLIGHHAMVRGNACSCDPHEAAPEGVSQFGSFLPDGVLPAPRIAVVNRAGYAQGVPTLFLGRSKRGNQHSQQRWAATHLRGRYSSG